ncbi:MAG: hypothetical protein J1F01_05485 [Oscillospiraceae bacterium]|nr:hypothetical protein [Oscillospiraceae bacterium]
MKKKELIAGILIGAVVTGTGAFAVQYVATDNPFPVKLDGNNVNIQGYNIEGSTYFKLRDVADAVGGFDVDFKDNTIVLTKNSTPTISTPQKDVYNIGETWTVDGQWALTIDGVTETKDRNQFSDKTPGAVYIVDYTYTNLGYEDKYSDGLYWSLDDTIVDNAGFTGYSYPASVTKSPERAPVGATCKAQDVIAVDNPGGFTLTLSKYDSNSKRQSARFYVEVN